MNWLRKLRARWRLAWGLCPACNSDAPTIDACPVCLSYRTPFPPCAARKRLWLRCYELTLSRAGGRSDHAENRNRSQNNPAALSPNG